MVNGKNVLAIIPARAGSVRIPNKNIRILAGKPLIAWTILEARKSAYIDRLIVSTDNSTIAQVAQEYGAEVPFMRPTELAADNVQDLPVFEHALKYFEEMEGYKPDIIVQLRPTSPLRTVKHIDDAIELLARHPDADSVRTVAEPEQSPYKMYGVSSEGFLEPLLTIHGEVESFNMLAQALPRTFKHVGYADVIWYRTLAAKKMMTGNRVIPLVIDSAYSGINTEADWGFYEYLMQKRV